MIRFHDVSARYPRDRHDVLDSVSLTAPAATVTAIVGPNGSGKSTLVRLLLRRLPTRGGHIEIDTRPLDALDPRAFARHVAVVPQREDPVFSLPVREYVALGRYPHEGPWRAATARDAALIEQAMRDAGIGDLAERDIRGLSGGEWQRARIARALAQGGETLVLDEPTTFLDVGHEMAMFELFAALARAGRAVLVISHQLNLIARFADVMVLLHQGKVAAAGAPAVVMQATILERVYQWPLVVTRDPAVGAPALVPLRGHRGSSGSEPSRHSKPSS